MQDQIEQLSSSASSVGAVAASKVALGAVTLGAGEVAKAGGGWMVSCFFLGVNTVQVFQLISAIYMLISIYKFFSDKKKLNHSLAQSKPVLSVNSGGGKPLPRKPTNL